MNSEERKNGVDSKEASHISTTQTTIKPTEGNHLNGLNESPLFASTAPNGVIPAENSLSGKNTPLSPSSSPPGPFIFTPEEGNDVPFSPLPEAFSFGSSSEPISAHLPPPSKAISKHPKRTSISPSRTIQKPIVPSEPLGPVREQPPLEAPTPVPQFPVPGRARLRAPRGEERWKKLHRDPSVPIPPRPTPTPTIPTTSSPPSQNSQTPQLSPPSVSHSSHSPSRSQVARHGKPSPSHAVPTAPHPYRSHGSQHLPSLSTFPEFPDQMNIKRSKRKKDQAFTAPDHEDTFGWAEPDTHIDGSLLSPITVPSPKAKVGSGRSPRGRVESDSEEEGCGHNHRGHVTSAAMARAKNSPRNFKENSLTPLRRRENEEKERKEREAVKQFWMNLSDEQRRELVKVEKEAVLKKMKEQQKHSCSCSVCGRRRNVIEEELEMLYDAYYEELEHYEGERKSQQSSNSEDFSFSNSLTVKGGILTVADDLLKNEGKKFLDMMEKLAERRMKREEEVEEEETDEEWEEEWEEEGMNEEQRLEEGRKMFQLFASKMFEQRVLAAYREDLALKNEQKLVEEEEEEQRKENEKKELKLQKAKQKKERKKLVKQQIEEKREAKRREKERLEAKRLEEEKKRIEKERALKKEAERAKAKLLEKEMKLKEKESEAKKEESAKSKEKEKEKEKERQREREKEREREREKERQKEKEKDEGVQEDLEKDFLEGVNVSVNVEGTKKKKKKNRKKKKAEKEIPGSAPPRKHSQPLPPQPFLPTTTPTPPKHSVSSSGSSTALSPSLGRISSPNLVDTDDDADITSLLQNLLPSSLEETDEESPLPSYPSAPSHTSVNWTSAPPKKDVWPKQPKKSTPSVVQTPTASSEWRTFQPPPPSQTLPNGNHDHLPQGYPMVYPNVDMWQYPFRPLPSSHPPSFPSYSSVQHPQ